ncbi:methyltransferase domain-containing protein [Pedobacter antarcticus]|uniref:methyltransferase domain-containing protein n=1 Tax=Pedobacter antarcticus TaxID=34086 RepID=UPI000888B664|nr:methyltransferase domain-containing protein [Pedobacter antarcticus]SDM26262.1 Methyltransferase domain-containing protein [Pedobacter antarcticus]
MPDFTERSTQKEIMDNFALPPQEIDPVLRELEIINKLLGGFSVFYNAFKYIKLDNGDRICDWGCGGGDSLRVLHKYFSTKQLKLNFIGIDATPAAIAFANRTHEKISNIQFRKADVLEEEFRPDEFDVVISSLFTHHFDNDEWVNLIGRMMFSAKKAVVINDLHRHWLAYHSIGILTRLFSKSPMVQHDSKLSVLRSFRKKELEMLLQRANVKNYRIKWMWAFRWQVIIYK